jgi:ankyrin repeat protein
MTTRQLPEQPDLEQLKRQAKDLLRAAQAGDSDARARFRALPAFAGETDEDLAGEPLALHDAQSVIAREHGFRSWNALRDRVEELTLELGAAVVRFIEAATDGRADRAERLLALHPRIRGGSFHAALVLGDATEVESHLSRRAALARETGGPRGWEPLLYVCHTCLRQGSVASADGLVAIARRLLALDADPNARFPWLHHGVRRAALWGACFVTRLLPLAELLLEAGADPDDGVTLPLAAGGGDVPVLELLVAHGADVDHSWATDGASPLYSILTWADTPVGVRWLLEHGADPDAVFAGNGETPLHVAARRWGADVARLLVDRGADVARRRADGRTPYAVAELNGNRAVADWLLEQGASGDLSEVDRLVAACSRGDRASADAMLTARPGLRREIGPEHHGALLRAAERGDNGALETMLACGFDPNWADEEIGKTALHAAAQAGWPEAVRTLLVHGASVEVRDREFHGQPLVWAADGWRSARRDGRDHLAVARLLLDAGSPVDWEAGEEPAQVILDILKGWRRRPEERTL